MSFLKLQHELAAKNGSKISRYSIFQIEYRSKFRKYRDIDISTNTNIFILITHVYIKYCFGESNKNKKDSPRAVDVG